MNIFFDSRGAFFWNLFVVAFRLGMKQDQRLAVIFAVAVLAAGIGGAYISEAKIQMQNLKAVMISDGMEMVPELNQFEHVHVDMT